VVVVAGVLLRSRWPVVAFGTVAATTLAGALLGVTWDPFAAAAWTLYPVAVAHGSARMSRAMSVALGLTVAAMLSIGVLSAWEGGAVMAAWLVITFAVTVITFTKRDAR
jgi:hypothetical protein